MFLDLIYLFHFDKASQNWTLSNIIVYSKSAIKPRGLIFCSFRGGTYRERVITEGGVLLTQRKTFYTNGLLHSLCIASIGKSVQAILAVNSY